MSKINHFQFLFFNHGGNHLLSFSFHLMECKFFGTMDVVFHAYIDYINLSTDTESQMCCFFLFAGYWKVEAWRPYMGEDSVLGSYKVSFRRSSFCGLVEPFHRSLVPERCFCSCSHVPTGWDHWGRCDWNSFGAFFDVKVFAA